MNAITQTNDTVELVWRATLAIAAVAVFAVVPMEAMAGGGAGGGALENVLCNIVHFITGGVGKALATLALVIVGIGALMGKISWGMALIVAIGIALVFGATTMVEALGASNTAGTACTGAGTDFQNTI